MKFFVVFACALAAASAGYVSPLVYGAQHLPLIDGEGVPVDTAAVQHAKAAHLVHKINVQARNGDLYHHGVVAAPVVASASVYGAPLASPVLAHHVPAAYPTTHVLPASVNGVPLETPEVVAAKVNHFAAHAEALARNAHAVHYRKRRGIYAAAPLAVAYQAQHLPIIDAQGVPVDTAAVQHAKAAHLVHKINVQARNGDYHVAAPIVATTYAHSPLVAATSYAHGYAAPLAYSKYLY